MNTSEAVAGLAERLRAAVKLGDATGARGKHPNNIYNLAAEALDALAARDARIAELVAELEAEKARSDMMRVQRDGHAAEAERTRADEREACAKIAAAGVYYRVGQGKCFAPGSREIAAAILARAALPSAPTEETSHEG